MQCKHVCSCVSMYVCVCMRACVCVCCWHAFLESDMITCSLMHVRVHAITFPFSECKVSKLLPERQSNF